MASSLPAFVQDIVDSPMLGVAYGVSTLVALVLLFIFSTWPRAVPKGVPGPGRDTPYFGGLLLLMKFKDNIPEYIERFSNEYGFKTWAFPLPGIGLLKGPAYIVLSPENVKYILADNFDNYVKGAEVQRALREFLGDGIFAADGPQWLVHRKVASNMFSRNLLRESTKIAVEHAERLVDHLRRKFEAGESNVIDIQDTYFRLTMDIFTFIAFGEDLKAAISPNPPPFSVAFDTVQKHSEARFFNPLWNIQRMFGLTEAERVLKQQVGVMNDFAKQVISSRRRDVSQNKLGPDLISRFLENAKKNDAQLSDVELRDIVMNFMIAGRDTTACALSWMLYEIGDLPDVQQRMREEFEEAHRDGREISYDTVDNMRFTHSVTQEVLRLHPSVPKDLKFAIKDDTLPDGTKILAGSSILYAPYVMGRDPSLWDKPEEFIPDRFLGQQEPSMYKYTAFNAGKRLCLGKPLALMEIKLITSILLKHFNIEIAEKHDGGYLATLVLPMKPGLMVRLTPR